MFVNIGNIIAQDLKTGLNEKVSTGDAEMSLHIRSPKNPGGGVFWGSQNSKYSKWQDLPKF